MKIIQLDYCDIQPLANMSVSIGAEKYFIDKKIYVLQVTYSYPPWHLPVVTLYHVQILHCCFKFHNMYK